MNTEKTLKAFIWLTKTIWSKNFNHFDTKHLDFDCNYTLYVTAKSGPIA